jgi:hypothetical protein
VDSKDSILGGNQIQNCFLGGSLGCDGSIGFERRDERAAGRVPRKEYSTGAWVRCDEAAARDSAHWPRLRKLATPWCPILGQKTGIDGALNEEGFFRVDSHSRRPREGTQRPREREI